MPATCNITYAKGTDHRPTYVGAKVPFIGGAKIFPQPLDDGREPFFLSYQTQWSVDNGIMLFAEKSRQIGWTWTSAHGIARRHALKEYALDTWGTSRDDLQAMLAVADCKAFAEVLHAGAQDLGQQVLDKGSSAHVLSFANGTRYYSLSSNPDAQAGKRGNRIADEFALNKDNRSLYAIMEPGVTWGGFIWLFSTHRGSGNYFNQLLLEARHKGNPKGWHVYRVTLQDALDCGFLYKLQCKLAAGNPSDPRLAMDEAEYFDFVRSKAADEETFQQEYMCVPSDDASAFISYALLDGNKYAPGVEWQNFTDGELYLGVDVARTRDLTVFYLIEHVSGVFFTRMLTRMQNAPFSEQEAVLYELMEKHRIRRCCIDQSGIGRQFAERAVKRFGSRVEGINFTGSVKESLAYPLKAALEDRTLKIPDDAKLIAAFRSIRKETTSSNNIRFVGDRTTDGHADEFWAAALALHATSAIPIGAPPSSAGNLRRAGGRGRAARLARRQRSMFG